MTNKFLELRTKLILCSVVFAFFFLATKSHATGGWPFHIPELEGGLEATVEILQSEYNSSIENKDQFAQQMDIQKQKHDELMKECEELRKDIFGAK